MKLWNVQFPQKIDQFQVGCTLFYLCVYKPIIKGSCQSFNQQIEYLDISFLRLRQEQALQEKSILSISQMDLLQYLIQPDPLKRKDLQDLSNHHWFVNEKANFKQIGKQKLLPSLRTILEIREQSSMEVKLTRVNQRLSITSIESHDEEELCLQDLNCSEDNQQTDFISILNLSVHKRWKYYTLIEIQIYKYFIFYRNSVMLINKVRSIIKRNWFSTHKQQERLPSYLSNNCSREENFFLNSLKLN